MHRVLLAFVLLAISHVSGVRPALAQSDVEGPMERLAAQLEVPESGTEIQSAIVGSLAVFGCILPLFITVLCWVSAADWVSRDTFFREAGTGWNLAMVVPFVGAILTIFLLLSVVLSDKLLAMPLVWLIGFPIALIVYLVPTMIYVARRNAQVAPHEKVLTKVHLRRWSSKKAQSIGVKIAAEGLGVDEIGPPVMLKPRGAASEREDSINLLHARQSIGYVPAREVLFEAFGQRADGIMLDYTQEAVSARFQIDGVWHAGESRDRETGDALLEVFKMISALNPAERRAMQQGQFGVEYEKKKHTCKITTQGTPTGERALIQFVDTSLKDKRLPDIGMREKMVEQLKNVLESKAGMVVVSAPPGGGLSTLLAATVGSTDRFMRSFICVEPANAREMAVENVPITTYDPAAGQTPMAVLPKLIREHPDAWVVADMVDAEAANVMCNEVSGNQRLVITTVRAKEAAEALLRPLTLGLKPKTYGPVVLAAVNQRLVRKLCEECKEEYPPPPQVLQQLGIPAGRVAAFFRPPQEPQKVCEKCRGLGYFGRTAMFELLVVDDRVRKILSTAPKLDTIRQAARQAGMRTLQEDGLVLVVKGETSLEELTRALKQ